LAMMYNAIVVSPYIPCSVTKLSKESDKPTKSQLVFGWIRIRIGIGVDARGEKVYPISDH